MSVPITASNFKEDWLQKDNVLNLREQNKQETMILETGYSKQNFT